MAEDERQFTQPLEWESESSQYVRSDKLLNELIALMLKTEFEDAASLYMRAGDAVGDELVRRFAADPDRAKRLANVLFRAKDFSRAAQVCENLGEVDKAAELYEKCNQPEKAAKCFLKVGDTQQAADRFERAGNAKRAAALFLEQGNNLRAAINFEKAGDFFEAGRNYFLAEQDHMALETLQKLEPGAQHEIEAVQMICHLLERQGSPAMAIPRLRLMFDGRRLEPKLVDLYYRLGELELEHGDRNAARSVFHQLAAFDPSYKDVTDRVQRLDSEPGLVIGEAIPSGPSIRPPDDLPGAPFDPAANLRPRASSVTLIAPEVEEIANFPVFADLSLQQVRTLFALSEARQFEPGQILIDEDEPGPGLFLVRSGLVRMLIMDDGGNDVTVADLPPGTHFGETSLLGDSPPLGRLEAIDPTTVLFIARDRFTSVVQSDPNIATGVYRALLRSLVSRLRATTRKMLLSAR